MASDAEGRPVSRPRIVLSSRELFPFLGGGIGAYVAQTAQTLAPVADVTILTASWFAEKYEELRAAGDPRVDFGGAELAFVQVPVPADHGEFYSHMHLYSHRVMERLRELFGDRGPDLIEFSDYLGEGFVPTQARRAGDPFLADTTIAVRVHTTAEICNVLNGCLGSDFESRISRDLERRALREADVVVCSGGDIFGMYERYYGAENLAPPRQIRYPMAWPEAAPVAPTLDGGPLRMIYVGRCERRKGVQDLIDALTAFTAEWHLTILGGDTPTAPLGSSMRRTLELQAAGDQRITFVENVARAEVPGRMAEHDLVVMPSRWECWPYVALEAFAAGMPVAATPVGGLREMIRAGVNGWLAAGTGTDALMDLLGPLVADPALVRQDRDRTALAAHLHDLADADASRDAYLALAAGDGRRELTPSPAGAAAAGLPPLVSIVIPYHGMARYVEETVASACAQTHPRVEVIVVDDGSFEAEDVVLAELATRYPIRVVAQENRGLGGARNFGIALSRGRYVLPLDADNVLEPTFAARGVALLEADPELAYVTSWSRYMDEDGVPLPPPAEGYRPVGNWSTLVEERNVAGDGTAVVRRSVFDRHRFSEDLTSFEDWALYRGLARAGRHGRVIPEMLWRYRVREQSMLREVGLGHDERLRDEMDALIREQEVTWVSRNG
jgi:glycogen(starch) synthase